MTNDGKIQELQFIHVKESEDPVTVYYEVLEKIGGMKYNYADYMMTEPIECDIELKRLMEADYELCCALLTMLLREDHFLNGSFERRYKAGQVQMIVDKMIKLLGE